MSRASYGELESALGIRRNPHGLVADRDLCNLVRPVDTLTYDWVHAMLQGGC